MVGRTGYSKYAKWPDDTGSRFGLVPDASVQHTWLALGGVCDTGKLAHLLLYAASPLMSLSKQSFKKVHQGCILKTKSLIFISFNL